MKKFVSYFEIPTADFNRAVTFYETVFHTKLEKHCYGKDHLKAFFPGDNGKYQGAVSHSPDCVPFHNGVFISFEVEDMDRAIQRIENSGGKIIHPKQKIEEEGFGYSCLFMDSEGNRIGLTSDK